MKTEPSDFPPEFLAAYVDGELGPRDRSRVERWLADHPEARELLETQESLTRCNGDLWFALTPPQPSTRQWAQIFEGVARGIRPLRHRRGANWSGAALLATAAALFIVIAAISRNGTPMPEARHAGATVSVAENEVPFAMAGEEEVRIVSLPEDAAALLVVGQHPLAGSILQLAKADELEFIGVGSDLAGRFPELPGEMPNEEPPVLWAPR